MAKPEQAWAGLRWHSWLIPPRFEPAKEADYLYRWRLDMALRLQRIGGWLALCMYVFALIADQSLGTRVLDARLFWSFGILSGAMALIMAGSTYFSALRERAYTIAFVTLLINGCALISMTAYTRENGNGFPSDWTLVLLIFTFVLTGMPYRLCVPLGLTLGALDIVVGLFQRLPMQVLADNTLIDGSMMALGVIACSALERTDRLSWLRSRQMLARSNSDELTGMRNRRYLFESGEQRLLLAEAIDLPIAVLMADIDYFKRLNDSLGHAAGDQCLRDIAAPLEQSLRHPDDIAARLGGEEFALLFFACKPEAALLRAEALRESVERLGIANPGSPLHTVTISIGIAGSEGIGKQDLEALLLAADKALYRAKEGGRNRVQS